MMQVKAWEEKVTIPTYAIGKPEKNPMFLEKRVYQGSSGVVYPHAVIESISDCKSEKQYTALYLENAYLKITGKLFNGTPFPQTFLWWSNPAVKVNDHYQSVFPPDVYAVFDHGKRDVSSFPIAKGIYYKVNYAPGTDISRYKNIPVPTSYMAIQSQYDFIGGYEHDTQAGMLHVADHHISPGKK